MPRRMALPAPWSDKLELGDGTYCSVPWTKAARKAYIEEAGGWFKHTALGLDPRYRLARESAIPLKPTSAAHRTCRCELSR